MKSWISAACAAACTLLVVETQENGREPPARFRVDVGGQVIDATEGIPFEIRVGGERVEATIHARDTRLFLLADVRFEYPAFFGFEESPMSVGEMWTLDGNAVSLQFMRSPAWGEDAAAAVRDMKEGLRASFSELLEERADTLDAGGAHWVGARFHVRIGEIPVAYRIFGTARGGKVYLVMLQDSLDDEDRETEEFSTTLELLRNTFAWD